MLIFFKLYFYRLKNKIQLNIMKLTMVLPKRLIIDANECFLAFIIIKIAIFYIFLYFLLSVKSLYNKNSKNSIKYIRLYIKSPKKHIIY